MSVEDSRYEIEVREEIARTEGLRVQVLTVGAGQCIPWHRHAHVTDTFFCLRAPLLVRTRHPEAVHRLEAEDRCAVPHGQPHRVSGVDDGPCRFAIVQGVGAYDYLPES